MIGARAMTEARIALILSIIAIVCEFVFHARFL